MHSTLSPYRIERLKCPPHFQERITNAGGRNRYGQPNFRLAWAQTELTRQGGRWEADGERFEGYRDVYLGDGLPHWMLLEWADAGKSIAMPHLPPESDVRFYADNRCPQTGLCLLGPYPYHGSYQVALPLVAKWFEGGQLKIRAFPLSTEIVNMMIPVIRAATALSVEAKLRYLKECSERDEAQYAAAVGDAYNSVKLPDRVKTSEWIEDKVRSMEKHFNAALIARMYRDRVFQRQNRL